MSSTVPCVVILLACAFTFSAAQTSCKDRCGAEYYRGYMCQCDYNCLSYGECCKDYESQCTTKNSCKGRCGENFKRGRLCNCDSDCIKYNQCCSDYKSNCDAEVITTEEVSGAASATAPVKTNSCHNVNNNKPKEPPLDDAAVQDSSFNDGVNTDDHWTPVNPTSYPQDDVSNDMDNQKMPTEELPDNGLENPEASPIPEITSGYGLSTGDLLDQTSAEPTQEPDALEFSTVPPDNEITQADDNPYPSTTEEAVIENTDASDPDSSTDAGTTVPQPTTSAAGDSPQVEVLPEDEDVPEAQNTDPTVAPSDMPEVTTTASDPSESTGPTQDSPVDLEDSQVSTTPASSTLDPTAIPEAVTSNPGQDDIDLNVEDVTTAPPLPDLEDPSIGVSPADSGNLSELDALTTPIPTSADAAQDDATPAGTTADPFNATPEPTKPASPEATSKPQIKPKPYKPPPVKPAVAKPSSKPETKPWEPATVNIDDPREYQADDSNDTNLCSGRPVGAVTTLRNGTIVVFRGHYFWFLDRNRVPGPARGITQVWGVPSPIDTAFTRCSCQGKTYIFKGTRFWRFENDVLDPGYPKVIETGFDGLRGHITAALSVPQYQRRRESVYFFKRGGLMQKYSYQHGTSPTCGRKPPQYAIYTVRNRIVRQAVSALSPTINIRTSWRGFPSTITAAVSVPSNSEPDGYKYYVFSRSKSYNVRMDSERPVIAPPAANAAPRSDSFLNCPKKV